MEQTELEGYRIDEKIYKVCLEAISKYCKNYGIAGGSGVSLHICPKGGVEATRKTDDMDISIYPQPTKSDISFQFGRSIRNYLQDKEYLVEFNKPKTNYEIKVTEKDVEPSPLKAINPPYYHLIDYTEESQDKEPFFIHFSRRSKKYLDLFEDRIKREIENAREVKIPDTEEYIQVIRPEDLILPKLIRRKEKDIQDIKLLIRYVDLDKNYLNEYADNWYHEEKLTDDMLSIFNGLYNKYKL